MELIFVRHGQTEWNKENRLLGHTDMDLDDEGIQEARELLSRLDPDFELIYSSPLKRCRETAEIIAQHFGKKIMVSDNLLERDFGSFDGKTWKEINRETGKDMKTIDHDQKYDYRAYGGESAEQVKARVLKFLEEAKRQPHEKALVVCHVGVIWMMYLLFPAYKRRSVSNASVHKFVL
jgi:broad specificity phosphatase PhoE